ncbi:hypothetical protein [Mangrovimonas sp. ST2L15]|uniref:hypothetical protein n=1 Tax=Mangrovimonas sp. ST2L15 TaxID=1645916 RepID=UPI0012FB23F1|nr:hypothetical protein [Mangrovimonas sp. ST2L15]
MSLIQNYVVSKYLQSQFLMEKLPNTLQNLHELKFVDFIKELNKSNKKFRMDATIKNG